MSTTIFRSNTRTKREFRAFLGSPCEVPNPNLFLTFNALCLSSIPSYLPGLDWLLGTDKAFKKWNAERKRRMKEGTWLGEDGKGGVKYVQDVDKQTLVVEEIAAAKDGGKKGK